MKKCPEGITEIKVEFALSAVLAAVTKWYELGQPVAAEELGCLIQSAVWNPISQIPRYKQRGI